jgi:pimeloyl-ACP methyl ester carboxylesterase
MPKKNHFNIKELRDLARLLGEATEHITDLVEDVNKSVVHQPFIPKTPVQSIISGIMGFTFERIRQVNKLVHKGIDKVFEQFNQEASLKISMGNKSNILAALNGILGDYLVAKNNALAVPMQIKKTESALSSKLLIMVHGLCMNDEQWNWKEHNHGAALAAAFGMSVVYVHYNTGQRISTNGKDLDQHIQQLVDTWAVPLSDIIIIGHSMGGLVSRSAVHYAEKRGGTWLKFVRKICFLGTPHHGAAVERLGSYVDFILESLPFIRPFARIGKIRSAGIEDLRFGNIRDEDWQHLDSKAKLQDRRTVVKPPEHIVCYAVAAVLGATDCEWKVRILGDSLVQIESALGQHNQSEKNLGFKSENTLTIYNTNHFELLSSELVYAQLHKWLGE